MVFGGVPGSQKCNPYRTTIVPLRNKHLDIDCLVCFHPLPFCRALALFPSMTRRGQPQPKAFSVVPRNPGVDSKDSKQRSSSTFEGLQTERHLGTLKLDVLQSTGNMTGCCDTDFVSFENRTEGLNESAFV